MGLFSWFKHKKEEELPKFNLDSSNDASESLLKEKSSVNSETFSLGEDLPPVEEIPQEKVLSEIKEELPAIHVEDLPKEIPKPVVEEKPMEVPKVEAPKPVEEKHFTDDLFEDLPSFTKEIPKEKIFEDKKTFKEKVRAIPSKEDFFVTMQSYVKILSNIKKLKQDFQKDNTSNLKKINTKFSKSISKQSALFEEMHDKLMAVEYKLSR